MKRSESSDSFHASPSKRRKVDTGVVARAASLQPSAAVRISLDDGENSAEPLLWTDPRTGERFQIDQRTGNSFLVGNTGSTENNGPVLRRRRTLAPQLKETSVGDGTAPSWIQSALKVRHELYTGAASTHFLSVERCIYLDAEESPSAASGVSIHISAATPGKSYVPRLPAFRYSSPARGDL